MAGIDTVDESPESGPGFQASSAKEHVLNSAQRYAQIFEILKHRHVDVTDAERDNYIKRMQEIYAAMSHKNMAYFDLNLMLDTQNFLNGNKEPFRHPTDFFYMFYKKSDPLVKINGVDMIKSGAGHNGHIAITGNKVEFLKSADEKGVPATFGLEDAYRMALLAANTVHVKYDPSTTPPTYTPHKMKINGTAHERAILQKAIGDVNELLPPERRIVIANPLGKTEYGLHKLVIHGSIQKFVGTDVYHITEPRRSFPDASVLEAAAAKYAPAQPEPEMQGPQKSAEPEFHGPQQPAEFTAQPEHATENISEESLETAATDAESNDQFDFNGASDKAEDATVDALADTTVEETVAVTPEADGEPETAQDSENISDDEKLAAAVRAESHEIVEESSRLDQTILEEEKIDDLRYKLIMQSKAMVAHPNHDQVQKFTDLANDYLSYFTDKIREESSFIAQTTDGRDVYSYSPSKEGIVDTAFYMVENGDGYKVADFKIGDKYYKLDAAHVLDKTNFNLDSADVEKAEQFAKESNGDAWSNYTRRAEEHMATYADSVLDNSRVVGTSSDGRHVFSYSPPSDEGHLDTLTEYIFVYDENDQAHILRFGFNGMEHVVDSTTEFKFNTVSDFTEKSLPRSEEIFAALEKSNSFSLEENDRADSEMGAAARAAIEGISVKASTPVEALNVEPTDIELATSYVVDNNYQPFAPMWSVQPAHGQPLSEYSVIAPSSEAMADVLPIATALPKQIEQQATPKALAQRNYSQNAAANDEYAWVRDNVIVPYSKHFKNVKAAELVDEINKTLAGRHPQLTIANDDLLARLKDDHLIQTKSDKTGEKITKLSTYSKYSEEYETIVQGLVSNRDVWLKQGYDSFEITIANLRNTTVKDLDPIAGPKPWSLWQRLVRDGVISVSGKDKTAIILDVSDGLLAVKHLNLKNDFTLAAAMPPLPEPKIINDLNIDNAAIPTRPVRDIIELGVKTASEQIQFQLAASGKTANGLGSNGLAGQHKGNGVDRPQTLDNQRHYAAE